MDATLILIDSDAELARARALVDRLWQSDDAADMVPILGTPSRVSEVLQGKKELGMGMVQRLRARFHIPADLLLPPPKRTPASRPTKRAAA
jgi:hypothetical protein